VIFNDIESEKPFKYVFSNEDYPEADIDAIIEFIVFVEEDVGKKSVHLMVIIIL
jgi:hypothetical protein